jgi:hypothetical protein
MGARAREFFGKAQERWLVDRVHIPELGREAADHSYGTTPVHPGQRLLDLAVLEAKRSRHPIFHENLGALPTAPHGGLDDGLEHPRIRPGEIAPVRHA